MSWTDYFPFMTNEQVDEYEKAATNKEKKTVINLFKEASCHGAKNTTHIVSASLFWKPAFADENTYPAITREMLLNPKKFNIKGRFEPWTHYVLPLIKGARKLKLKRPDVRFRVYLAADLSFLVPILVKAGCEVRLMASNSIRHNPGAMWRFLAMEHDGLVTITDSDRADRVIYDVERTELVAKAGLSHWRVAYTWGEQAREERCPAHYRPIIACQFGSATKYPMRLLCEAFLWHTFRESIPIVFKRGNDKPIPIFGTDWPNYGFDEWFLLAAVFPRMALNGVLTFVEWNDRFLNHWFALDIEFCTWANPKSEIMYHSEPPLKKLIQLKSSSKDG